MPSLHEIGLKYGTDKATHHGYCEFYEKNLPGRDFKGSLLEIGIKDGASLKMWQEYYPHANIHGLDLINARVKGCTTHVMDQCDIVAMQIELPVFDIIIDDGSHMTLHQQISFDMLYECKLSTNGFYVMEDLHTSFYPDYVNSKYNTDAFLKSLFNAKDRRSWCRVPDFSDSYTMIIAKNKFPDEL
jgi:hypothetical protein